MMLTRFIKIIFLAPRGVRQLNDIFQKSFLHDAITVEIETEKQKIAKNFKQRPKVDAFKLLFNDIDKTIF